MIFSSPYPDVAIPDAPLTAFVLRHAERLADKPAMIDGTTGRTLTYGQLAEAIDRTAAGLSERGFRRGSVLAIYSPNCPEYAVAFHAAASLGGITTTVNPMFTSDELTYQLREAAADWLLTTPALMDTAREAAARTGVREIFVFGDTPGGTPGATPLGHLSPAAGAAPRVPIDASVDLVALPFSSGTTGLPKGVMLTHANLAANVAQIAACEDVTETDTLIGVLPFFHIYGLTVLMNFALSTGATVVTMPRFELEPFLQIMEAHAVTYAYLAPPIVLALAKQPAVDRYDLSRLRVIVSGGAPLGAEVGTACRQRLGCIVKQGYGLTEASPVTHLNPSDPDRVKAGTIGLLVPNTVAKVIDPESGAALGPEARGEVWLRGPQIMQGYVNRPDATAEMITPDGWLRTGDLGFVDLDGHFTIVDRLKELIKYKGYQVAPAELEALLLSHPAVADAAVIPSPDEAAGEVPKAFVVARGEVTANELMAFVAERVAPYKRIRRVAFVDQIPKSPSGKILRRILVERERADVLIPA
jgi:acyl-CoA synthetase (AMP-forming)/AMP-acid ligase II